MLKAIFISTLIIVHSIIPVFPSGVMEKFEHQTKKYDENQTITEINAQIINIEDNNREIHQIAANKICILMRHIRKNAFKSEKLVSCLKSVIEKVKERVSVSRTTPRVTHQSDYFHLAIHETEATLLFIELSMSTTNDKEYVQQILQRIENKISDKREVFNSLLILLKDDIPRYTRILEDSFDSSDDSKIKDVIVVLLWDQPNMDKYFLNRITSINENVDQDLYARMMVAIAKSRSKEGKKFLLDSKSSKNNRIVEMAELLLDKYY